MTCDVNYGIIFTMFFRIHKFKQNGKEYRYLRLVQNYRQNGRTRQRVIANFGNVSNLNMEEIKYLIDDLSRISLKKHKTPKKARNGSGGYAHASGKKSE